MHVFNTVGTFRVSPKPLLPHLAPPSSIISLWFGISLARTCLSTQGWFKGFFPAVIASVGLAVGGVLLLLPITRKLIARSLPGEGVVVKERCVLVLFDLNK